MTQIIRGNLRLGKISSCKYKDKNKTNKWKKNKFQKHIMNNNDKQQQQHINKQ